MTTKQIRIGNDCVNILDSWRYEGESYTDAIRRMSRRLEKHDETINRTTGTSNQYMNTPEPVK